MVNDDVIRYDSKIVDKMANNGVWNTGGHSFSTLKVGRCRECRSKPAWGSAKKVDFCPHQQAMIRQAIHSGTFVSKKRRKTYKPNPLQSLAGRAPLTKKRRKRLKKLMSETYDDHPHFRKEKRSKKKRLTKKILLAKTLPKLKGSRKIKNKYVCRQAPFAAMEVDEEALIEHAFHLSDSYGAGFIHRSEFLTNLRFNDELVAAISGSTILRRLAYEKPMQSKFMRYRTKHMYNVTLAELYNFLGVRPQASTFLSFGAGLVSSPNAPMDKTGAPSIPSTAYYPTRKMNVETPPLDPSVTFSPEGTFRRRLMSLEQQLLAFKARLLGILRYRISSKVNYMSINQAAEAYKTASKLTSKLGSSLRSGDVIPDNLLTAIQPLVVEAVTRIDSVDTLLQLQDAQNALVKRIPRLSFLNFDTGEYFEKQLLEASDRLGLALGTGLYAGNALAIQDLRNAEGTARMILQNITDEMDRRQWGLERSNWPSSYRARMAATSFQNAWRSMKARQVLDAKKKMDQAVKHARKILVLHPWGAWKMFCTQKKNRRIQRNSAIFIQRVRRGIRDRSKVKRLHRLRHLAAIVVQRFIRSKRLLLFLKKKTREVRSATKIESIFRMYATKVVFNRKIARVRRAAFYRECILNQKAEERIREQESNSAAKTLQRAFKGIKARKRAMIIAEEMRKRRNEKAATILQAFWRTTLTRIRIKRMKKAVDMIQSWHKAKLDRWHFLLHFQRKQKGVEMVQKMWRGRIGRKIRDSALRRKEIARQVRAEEKRKAEEAERHRLRIEREKEMEREMKRREEITMNNAATKIQKTARGARDRKYTATLREEKEAFKQKEADARARNDAAAVAIQRTYRGFGGRETVKAKRSRHFAANSIQRVYRGKAGRKKANDRRTMVESKGLEEQHFAAINIQRIARGRIGRKHAHQKYEALDERRKRSHAATMIQKMRRGKAAREAVHARKHGRQLLVLQEREAATVIQKHIRGKLERTEYQKSQHQKFVQNSIQGSIDIQRVWRGYEGRRKAKAQSLKLEELGKARIRAAVQMQRVARGHLGRLRANDVLLEHQHNARKQREESIKLAAEKRKELAAEAMERNIMADEERQCREYESHLKALADKAEKERFERQNERKKKEVERATKAEENLRIERLSGLRDALEKAKGVESIRSIAYLIPDNEGEGFRELKAEALQRLEIAENGGANTGVVAEEEVAPTVSQPAEAEWTEGFDEDSGMTYYINSLTGETQWENPFDASGQSQSNEAQSQGGEHNATGGASTNIFQRVARRIDSEKEQ